MIKNAPKEINQNHPDKTVQVKVKPRRYVQGHSPGTVMWVTPTVAKLLMDQNAIDIIGGDVPPEPDQGKQDAKPDETKKPIAGTTGQMFVKTGKPSGGPATGPSTGSPSSSDAPKAGLQSVSAEARASRSTGTQTAKLSDAAIGGKREAVKVPPKAPKAGKSTLSSQSTTATKPTKTRTSATSQTQRGGKGTKGKKGL